MCICNVYIYVYSIDIRKQTIYVYNICIYTYIYIHIHTHMRCSVSKPSGCMTCHHLFDVSFPAKMDDLAIPLYMFSYYRLVDCFHTPLQITDSKQSRTPDESLSFLATQKIAGKFHHHFWRTVIMTLRLKNPN